MGGERAARADRSRRRGVLAVGRYAAVSGAPAFLEIHELLSDDAPVVAASGRPPLGDASRARAARRHGPARRRPGRRRPVSRAVGPAGVYGQIFPPGVDERAAVHGLPPALQIGRIDIPPAHEDEFNEWYNTEYLIGNMTVNGVYGARRYLNRTAGPRYLTVYEFAHTEVSRQPAWDRTRVAVGLAPPHRALLVARLGLARDLPPPGRALTRGPSAPSP